jgi:hypothetical protein
MADTYYSRQLGAQNTDSTSPLLFGGDDEMRFSQRRNPDLVKADKLMKQFTPKEAISIIDGMIKTGRIHMGMEEIEKILWISQKDQDAIMSNPDKAMVAHFKSKKKLIFHMAQALSWKTDAYNPIITALEELRQIHDDEVYSRAIKIQGSQNENDKQYGVLNTSIMKHDITQQQPQQVKKEGILKRFLGR